MGQTHPEQHGSPAWTYISTILFGIHNSFVEDKYCWWSFIYWSLILSLIQGQEKQTQSSRFQSVNCDMQFVKVKESLNWWSPQFSIPVWSQLTSSWWGLKTLYFFQSSEVEMQTVSIPHLIVLYFSSCHRLEAFNSFKLVFIIIMHFLLFNSCMQLPGVGNWSLGGP